MKGYLAKVLKSLLGSRFAVSSGSKYLKHPTIALMYHDLRDDYDECESWLKVSKSAFTQQLEELHQVCDFIMPSDLVDDSAGKSGRLRILLTFDDGFVNNYRIALPILEQYNVPALFFVSTENMETGEPFWFDLIISPIQCLKIESLDLRDVGLKHYTFPFGNAPRRWGSIQALLTDIKSLGNCSDGRVQDILLFFKQSFASSLEGSYDKNRPLTREEIKVMQQSGLCHFGSHSHRHDILTYLDESQIRGNLLTSKRLLEEVTGGPVVHLSYPNGDTNSAIESLSYECGYELGYGTQPGIFSNQTPRMQIPRVAVSGYDSLRTLLWKINKELMKEFFRKGFH